MTTKNYIAIDQYGQIIRNLGNHPRKELLRRLYRKHAQKIYVDGKDGGVYHVGYIIGGLWLTLYEVTPMKIKQ